jgi:hypothetical protein
MLTSPIADLVHRFNATTGKSDHEMLTKQNKKYAMSSPFFLSNELALADLVRSTASAATIRVVSTTCSTGLPSSYAADAFTA